MLLQRSDSKLSQGEAKLKICCSGFEPKTKRDFEKFITKIGGIYMETLQSDTNIMISRDVLSEKYRIACLLEIPVVSSDWLVDSFKAKSFLPTEHFKIPIFNGLTIGILGFPADEIEEIKKIISANKGEYCTSLAKIQEGKEMNLIIVKASEIKRYESFIFSLPIPAVSIDWLKKCILSSQYIKPNQFSLNQQKNTTRQSASQRTNETLADLLKCEAILNVCLNEFELTDEKSCYLEKVVVYFHGISGKLEKVLKKMVDACGGFYLDEVISDVTHVVTEEYFDTEIKNFNTFKEVKVVNPLWLKECLILKRLVKEEDYILQPMPLPEPVLNSQNSTSMQSLSRRNTLSLGGSSEDLGRVMKRLPSIQESKREHKERDKGGSYHHSDSFKSDKDKDRHGDKKKRLGDDKMDSKSKKKSVTIKGYVFKNINIYFEPNMKNLSYYKKLVEENSGRVLDHRNVFEEIYYIVPDSPDCLNIIKKKGKNERCVSFRWIDYCIKNKMIIRDIEQRKLIHLAPFTTHLPISSFKEKVIYCAGFSPYDKAMMKEVVELLGAKFEYTGNLDVLVVEDMKSKKVAEIKENNPNIPIVSNGWIFECINQGKFVDTNSFLIAE